MKTDSGHLLITPLSSALAILLLSPAPATTISAVNWGGQYVDSDLAFADDNPANHSASDKYGDPDGPIGINLNDSIAGRALSLDNPFSPTSGYAGTSDTFFGGGSVTRANSGLINDGFSEITVLNQGPNDSLHWQVDTGGDSHTFHLLLYWDKADFLGSLSTTDNLGLTEGSFSLTTSQVSANHNDEFLHWVVRDGNQFYVSEASIDLSNNSTYDVSYASLTSWANYDPVDPSGTATSGDLFSLDFNENSIFSPQTFTDVTAVGFYMEHEAATGPIHVHIEGFGASLVPEPSATLLALITLGGFVARRRRNS